MQPWKTVAERGRGREREVGERGVETVKYGEGEGIEIVKQFKTEREAGGESWRGNSRQS